MIREEIVHINEVPKKLLVFLHGYVDSSDSIDRKISLLDNFPNFAIHIPQAPLECEIYESKRQWYSMHKFDPEDERRTVPTMDECVALYNKMAPGLMEANDYLQPYIENALNEYGLDYKDLFLCGFSQGAMCALYTGLMFPEKIGGIISFSGILAGHKRAIKEAKTHPDVLLIHGNSDNLIRYEALDFTASELKKIGCKVETYTVQNGNHMIMPDALVQAAYFIRDRI